MSVRAKFRVNNYTSELRTVDYTTGEVKEIRTISLSPVYSSEEGSENKKFWDASPSGEIKLGTVNPEAWGLFELGEEYYVDFSRADKAEAVGK